MPENIKKNNQKHPPGHRRGHERRVRPEFRTTGFLLPGMAATQVTHQGQRQGHFTDTGRLRSSIHSRITSNSVIFYTDLPYAAIHNDGGEFIVTQRMKRFFRAKAYEAAGSFGRKKNSNTTQKNILRSATDSSTHGCTQPCLHPKPNSGAHFP